MLKSLVDYISLLYRSRIIFSVKPKNIVIFDCVNSYELSEILDNDKFIIISSRKEKIYKLYFTKNIILFVITNLFKTVYICKPITSRPAKSETNLIGKYFLGPFKKNTYQFLLLYIYPVI